jgi:hypothetical protein
VVSVHTTEYLGTRIEVQFGRALQTEFINDEDLFSWGQFARDLADAPEARDAKSRPSVHWHSPDSFARLAENAIPGTTVRQLIETFDGLSGAKASRVLPGHLRGRQVRELTRDEGQELHTLLLRETEPLKHSALGRVGSLGTWGKPKLIDTTIQHGTIKLPVRIEAWARPQSRQQGKPRVTVCVNRTPIPTKGLGKNKLSKFVFRSLDAFVTFSQCKMPPRSNGFAASICY